ncbi:MAG: S1C family serine protease [Acidobacteriota bacterium]
MLIELSSDIADIVEKIGPSVVQVQGDRRPASGLVYAPERVLTTSAAIGREEHPRVRSADGQVFDGEVVGWHSNTRLALLKVPGFNSRPAPIGVMPRVGHLAIAMARSWSNFVTVTSGLVSVIGGPLRVGHRRTIEQVIRTSAPMHEGFAGGALLGADGTLIGVTTAASIRGLGVSIPADVAWAAAAEIEKQGTLKRGYIGIAALPVRVPEKQKAQAGTDNALLVLSVKDGSPASTAGLIVGDLLLSLDGQALSSPDDLLDMLVGERVGRLVSFQVLRGGAPAKVPVSVAERS